VAARFPRGANNFFLAQEFYLMGTEGFSPGVKLPMRAADPSPPSSDEIRKKMELYLHFLMYFYGLHRDFNFTESK
jgi:hypothetical protein